MIDPIEIFCSGGKGSNTISAGVTGMDVNIGHTGFIGFISRICLLLRTGW